MSWSGGILWCAASGTAAPSMARRADCVIEIVPQGDDFVAADQPLFRIVGHGAPPPTATLYQSVAVGPELVRHGTARQGTLGLVILALLLGILGNGCTLIPKAVGRGFHGLQSLFSAGEPKPTIDPVKLQDDLLRYSDDITSTVLRAAMKLEKDGAPIPRKDLLTIWVGVDSAVIKTATGSNSLANLVNMIVLTTAMRMRVEEYWLPTVYGESARSMLVGLSSCEK